MLLDRWAQLDPAGGAAYFKAKADANPQDQLADDGLANFIRQWGAIDFEKAAAKAAEFGEKTSRRTFREKAKLDPEGFLAWAKDHPEINPFSIFLSTMLTMPSPSQISPSSTWTVSWRGQGCPDREMAFRAGAGSRSEARPAEP